MSHQKTKVCRAITHGGDGLRKGKFRFQVRRQIVEFCKSPQVLQVDCMLVVD